MAEGPRGRVLEIAWPPRAGLQAAAQGALERGEVVSLPSHGFATLPDERALMDPTLADGRAGQLSYDPARGELRGAVGEGGGEGAGLARLMARFAAWAQALIGAVVPAYAGAIETGKTSFRPGLVEARPLDLRKDDHRLHVDAFPRRPMRGRRILRVFANVDPENRPRVWSVGEPFEFYAARFLHKARVADPWTKAVLQGLGVTKGRRSAYDEVMLDLHDHGKADEAWQASAPHQRVSFAAGSSWIVFTDATLHAALEGQNALEQTFFLPIEAMAHPEQSPLRVLERMTGRALT